MLSAGRIAVPRNGAVVAATLLGVALVAWIVTVQRMRGMDAGPGTDLGGLGWFVGIWVTMMAAMMLPSVSPTVMLFARVSREQARRSQVVLVPTWLFVAGYLGVWTACGLVAYGIYRAFVTAGTDWLAWDSAGPYVAGAALAATGIYQLTPLKDVCLRHCRSPLHFLLHGWRPGRTGAVRMGAEHGAYCLGCCWGLMVALFALGVMSLFWMAVVGGVILAEKLAPESIFGGRQLSRSFAVALVALGVWVAAAAGSVPGLVQPNSPGAELARMKMMGMEPDHGSMTPIAPGMNPMSPMTPMTPTTPTPMAPQPPSMGMDDN
jgi:predicted metal-binding membrane protein